METKSSIRKRILQLRNALTEEEIKEKSRKICEAVLDSVSVRQAENILCYASYKSETATDILIQTLLERGKNVYLPRVSENEMDFFRIRDWNDLSCGFKNIPEPGMHCQEKCDKNTVMIMPGCAFCENGSRIGYGKGYYDRYLTRNFCKERIALCFEMQIVPAFSADIHDIPATKIYTEKRVIHIYASSKKQTYLK